MSQQATRHSARPVTGLLVVVLSLICALALAVDAAGASPGRGRLSQTAVLASTGRKLALSGAVPSCSRGRTVLLTVRVAQIKAAASGTWSHPCTGKTLRWQATLAARRGPNFGIGAATGYATAAVKRGPRTVAVAHWSSPLAISEPKRPTGRPTLREKHIVAGVTFSGFPGGTAIFIRGGGPYPSSNCTKNETDVSFRTDGSASERVLVSLDAKESVDDDCLEATQFSDFSIYVERQGSGRMRILSHLGSSKATCDSGPIAHDAYIWTGLKCEKTSEWELKVTGA